MKTTISTVAFEVNGRQFEGSGLEVAEAYYAGLAAAEYAGNFKFEIQFSDGSSIYSEQDKIVNPDPSISFLYYIQDYIEYLIDQASASGTTQRQEELQNILESLTE